MISNRIKFDPKAMSPMLFEILTTDKILVVPNENIRQDMINLWKIPEDRVEVEA